MEEDREAITQTDRLIDLSSWVASRAIDAVHPYKQMGRNILVDKPVIAIQGTVYDLSKFEKIHVLGAGKGAKGLYRWLDIFLVGIIDGGNIVTDPGCESYEEEVYIYPGSHPIPDGRSLKAGIDMLEYAKENVGENDLVFFLLTGGASAMLEVPDPGLLFEDVVHTYELMLRSGMDIQEMNSVRRSLSAIKGGKLAGALAPAQIITLAISDIVGSPIEDIGSGPTVPSPTDHDGVLEILGRHSLVDRLRPAVLEFLVKERRDRTTSGWDHTKEWSFIGKGIEIASNNHYYLLGDNSVLLDAIRDRAAEWGVRSEIIDSGDSGDVRDIAERYADLVRKVMKGEVPYELPILLIAGGELTVKVTGNGKGGRNQEFVLSMMLKLRDVDSPFFILSLGSDGVDGPTDAAGAWIDEKSYKKALDLGLDPEEYLRNNDSYSFFKKMEQLIVGESTQVNMMDVRMFYIGDFGDLDVPERMWESCEVCRSDHPTLTLHAQ